MNNKLPQVTFVYNRHRNATPAKKASVEIRITHNYKQKYISTGVMLYPHQWRNDKIDNCPDIMQISKMLEKKLHDVRQAICDMISEGHMDISSIPERIGRLGTSHLTFLDFCKQRAEIRKYGKRADTQERYNRFIRLFTDWGGISEFRDINESSIIAYDHYLCSKGMKAYSKWNNYHRFLNSFIMDAIDEGHLKRNPYRWVSIERDKHSRGIERSLTPGEFRKLRTATMPTDSITKVRDVFVFQAYTCLSYSDLRDFDYRMIQEVRGMNVYVGNRRKTGRAFTIPLLSPAMEILHKYGGRLPVISNVKYNEYLKIVAQAAGIDKPVSSHWARHTGATILLNEGVPMQVVSKICGHSSTKITEKVYAKLLDETVVDAIQEIQENLE